MSACGPWCHAVASRLARTLGLTQTRTVHSRVLHQLQPQAAANSDRAAHPAAQVKARRLPDTGARVLRHSRDPLSASEAREITGWAVMTSSRAARFRSSQSSSHIRRVHFDCLPPKPVLRVRTCSKNRLEASMVTRRKARGAMQCHGRVPRPCGVPQDRVLVLTVPAAPVAASAQ